MTADVEQLRAISQGPRFDGQTRADEVAAWTAAMWGRLERHARALDRSEAQHILRLRANHSAGQQRHVRTAVGW